MKSLSGAFKRDREALIVNIQRDIKDEAVLKLLENILIEIKRFHVRWVILDRSRVDTIDSFFARALARTTLMIKLMGGNTIIVGMRPAVAITIAEMGLPLGEVSIASNTERMSEILKG